MIFTCLGRIVQIKILRQKGKTKSSVPVIFISEVLLPTQKIVKLTENVDVLHK